MNNYSIEWSNKAREDLLNRFSFLSYEAASNFVTLMKEEIASLSQLPQRYPIFEMNNIISTIEFRKKVVDKRYIVIYAVYKASVKIYRILDSRKKFETLVD